MNARSCSTCAWWFNYGTAAPVTKKDGTRTCNVNGGRGVSPDTKPTHVCAQWKDSKRWVASGVRAAFRAKDQAA